MARRNIALNLRRSLLVGSLIAVAVVVTVAGGALFQSSQKGLKRTFVESFSGNLFISPPDKQTLSLFGVDTPVIGAYAHIPVLTDYGKVHRVVMKQAGVASATPQVTGYAVLESRGVKIPAVLFGVNGSGYFRVYRASRVVSGHHLVTGIPGIMISRKQAAELGGPNGHPLVPGDIVKLTAFTDHGFTIRQVPVSGIFEFPVRNAALARIAYVDAGTLRSLKGMVQGSGGSGALSRSDRRLLTGNLSNVFRSRGTVAKKSPGIGFSEVVHALSNTKGRAEAVRARKGTWNFLTIRLKAAANASTVCRELQQSLKAQGLEDTVAGWRAAAGAGAAISGFLSAAFDVGLLLLAVVIVFVLVNTLIIWVTQRTAEIGMIRALGGRRGFVFGLFFAESTLLALAAAIVGLLVGSALVVWLHRRGVPVGNHVLQLVFGGSVLRPELTVKNLLTGLAGALAIAWVGVIFPIRFALRVKPRQAMETE